MKDEFKQARDEMAIKNDSCQIEGDVAFKGGADWAYEWCGNKYADLELYDRQQAIIAELQDKLNAQQTDNERQQVVIG